MKYALHLLLVVAMASCSCSTPKASMHIGDAKVFRGAEPTDAKVKVEDNVRYLYLQSAVDGASVYPLIDAIKSASTEKYIVLEINSSGGSIGVGFLLSKAIENSRVPVKCVVDGPVGAASMAFYILQSCDVRVMTKRSTLMAHQAAIQTEMGGQQTAWDNVTRILRAIDHAMVEHMAVRMGMDVAAFEAKIEGGKEWWMNWEEASAVHAIDFATDSVKEALAAFRK